MKRKDIFCRSGETAATKNNPSTEKQGRDEDSSPSPLPRSGRGEGAGGRGEGPVPRLDLAPKLRRPLQIWNPLDYLRLLYWVFFFPQALRWYVETFADPRLKELRSQKSGLILWKDPVGRKLMLMCLILTPSLTILTGFACQLRTVSALDVMFSAIMAFMMAVLWGIMFYYVIGSLFDASVGFASGVVAGIAIGNATGIIALFTLLTDSALLISLTFGIALGLVINVVLGVVLSATQILESIWILRVGLIFNLVTGLVLGVIFATAFGTSSGLLVAITSVSTTLRLLDAAVVAVPIAITGVRKGVHHLTLIPLPKLQHHIIRWLEMDWGTGIQNVDQLLSYTLQYSSIASAINTVIEEIPHDRLLLAFDELVRSTSGCYVFTLLPEMGPRWIMSLFAHPVVNTTARNVCAGFWNVKQKELLAASKSFEFLRHLPYGEEMYGIAFSLHQALKEVGTPEDFSKWLHATERFLSLPGPYLHPGTMSALQQLGEVAAEANTAFLAVSPTLRSFAVGRALGILTQVIQSAGETCEPPEASIVVDVATRWLEILARWGGEIGEEVFLRPVENPFSEGASGRPVRKTFIGRHEVLARLERWWAGSPDTPLPVLILYGHRRMGKSSVLRQLREKSPPHILIAPTDMQDLVTADHTGQLLQKFAGAIHGAVRRAGLDPGPPPADADYVTFGQATSALNGLLERLDPQMRGRRLVLTVDEYELAEEKIAAGKFDPDFLRYLRAALGRHLWLNLILAGRQRLEEELRHYHAVFYGSAEPVKVSFLSRDEAMDLIRHPTDDFALDMEEPLAEEIYRLTGGQPYLIQRLCYELVERWNERFRREGRETPRRVTVEDLEAMLTPEFFREFFLAADYYFSGVWEEAGPDGQRVLRAFAERARTHFEALPRDALIRAAGLDPEAGEAALSTLLVHDLLVEAGEGLRLAVPLLHRWILCRG